MSTSETIQLAQEIRALVAENVDLKQEPTDGEIEEIITREVFKRSQDKYLSLTQKQELISYIFNSMRRLDIIQPLLEDGSVTEIMVNGPEKIFIERFGRVSKSELTFESQEKLEDVIQSIVAKVNRTVNEYSPIVDARLRDGSRVSAILQPVALNGPILTIRKFPLEPISMEELVRIGSLSREAAEALAKMVKARFNIFVCGGTGSGKTTFLNALSGFLPEDERIVTIEDSAELQIANVQNLVRLETRNANPEGRGQVTIRELIRASLRMRPDRIIVGEVRGSEALDMLQAMNTGHDGSLSTGHANSPHDILSRLETMVISGAALPLEAVRQQLASALDIIIHLARLRDKSRRVLEITEVAGCGKGIIELNPLYVFEEEDGPTEEIVRGSLQRTENPLLNTQKLKMAGLPADI